MKFSNLKSKRGSVLFIVLLVMSVLIVMAAAVYYTVASQREEVVAEYNGEQAYQTALSVDNIVTSYIVNKKNSDPFKQKMLGTGVGSSFTATKDDIDLGVDNLGDCEVRVERISNTSYKLITEVKVDEQYARLERIIELTTQVTPAGFDNRLFTSTGLAPNDCYLTAQIIPATAFFDNECVIFSNRSFNDSIGGGGNNEVRSDLICAGTLIFDGVMVKAKAGALDPKINIVVGNNYKRYIDQGGIDLGGGAIYIGGNFDGRECLYKNGAIYVLGDMKIATKGDFGNCDIYVKGDLTVDGCQLTGSFNLHVDGEIKLENGAYFSTGGKNYNSTSDFPKAQFGWTDCASKPDDYKLPDEIKSYIVASLGNPQYFGWTLEDSKLKKGNKYNIDFKDNQDLFVITESGVIEESKTTSTNQQHPVILIDTNVYEDDTQETVAKFQLGELDPEGKVIDNDSKYLGTPKCKNIYLTLQPKNGNVFTWDSNNSGRGPVVLVKGSGNVIFNIPDDVTYQSQNGLPVMHLGWFYEILGDNAVVFNADNTNVTQVSATSGLEGDSGTNKANSILTPNIIIDGESYYNLINEATQQKYGESGSGKFKNVFIHNNIFFISNAHNSKIDISATAAVLTGFIYAPYMILDVTGGGNSLAMIGGIIVSDYSIVTNRRFVCSMPFDYYHRNGNKKDNLFEELLNASGSPLGSSSVRSWRIVGYN